MVYVIDLYATTQPVENAEPDAFRIARDHASGMIPQHNVVTLKYPSTLCEAILYGSAIGHFIELGSATDAVPSVPVGRVVVPKLPPVI